jgi:hypothetical protein
MSSCKRVSWWHHFVQFLTGQITGAERQCFGRWTTVFIATPWFKLKKHHIITRTAAQSSGHNVTFSFQRLSTDCRTPWFWWHRIRSELLASPQGPFLYILEKPSSKSILSQYASVIKSRFCSIHLSPLCSRLRKWHKMKTIFGVLKCDNFSCHVMCALLTPPSTSKRTEILVFT